MIYVCHFTGGPMNGKVASIIEEDAPHLLVLPRGVSNAIQGEWDDLIELTNIAWRHYLDRGIAPEVDQYVISRVSDAELGRLPQDDALSGGRTEIYYNYTPVTKVQDEPKPSYRYHITDGPLAGKSGLIEGPPRAYIQFYAASESSFPLKVLIYKIKNYSEGTYWYLLEAARQMERFRLYNGPLDGYEDTIESPYENIFVPIYKESKGDEVVRFPSATWALENPLACSWHRYSLTRVDPDGLRRYAHRGHAKELPQHVTARLGGSGPGSVGG